MNLTSKDSSLYNCSKNGTSFQVFLNMKFTYCLQIFKVLYFPNVHIYTFRNMVILCMFFLKVDNFACNRFSLKE